MNNVNDIKIMNLKKQIEEKKVKLASMTKFSPITNLSLDLDGVRYNLNVQTKEQLINLLVKLTAYQIAVEKLKLEYYISGYNINDWITDINSKIEMLSKKDEERKLKAMEDKLNQLLSEEKKVELELNDIESLLK